MSRLDLVEVEVKILKREVSQLKSKLKWLEGELAQARVIQHSVCPTFPSRVVDIGKLHKTIKALLDHLGVEFVRVDEDRIIQKQQAE